MNKTLFTCGPVTKDSTAQLVNVEEGWNNHIDNILGRPTPNIKDALLCLKREAESFSLHFHERRDKY